MNSEVTRLAELAETGERMIGITVIWRNCCHRNCWQSLQYLHIPALCRLALNETA
jgi:hypothetical protein